MATPSVSTPWRGREQFVRGWLLGLETFLLAVNDRSPSDAVETDDGDVGVECQEG